jgi:hypothetical protein
MAANSNAIQYITINTTGNATDFANLSVTRRDLTGCSNLTNERAVSAGGYTTAYSNVIDYHTINSVGNATDFGNLTNAITNAGGLSNGTNERGCFGGGIGAGPTYFSQIDYITINSPGNAADFGDMTESKLTYRGATSNA